MAEISFHNEFPIKKRVSIQFTVKEKKKGPVFLPAGGKTDFAAVSACFWRYCAIRWTSVELPYYELHHTAETILRDVMTARHSTRRSAVRDVEPTASLTFWIKMSVFHDEIEIEDFEYDEDTETYYFPCPCGDKFAITKVRPALRQLVSVS